MTSQQLVGDISTENMNHALSLKMQDYPNVTANGCKILGKTLCAITFLKTFVKSTNSSKPVMSRKVTSSFRNMLLYLTTSLLYTLDDIFDSHTEWWDFATTVFLAFLLTAIEHFLATLDVTCLCHGRHCCKRGFCLFSWHCCCMCCPRFCYASDLQKPTGRCRCICAPSSAPHRAPLPLRKYRKTFFSIILAGLCVCLMNAQRTSVNVMNAQCTSVNVMDTQRTSANVTSFNM